MIEEHHSENVINSSDCFLLSMFKSSYTQCSLQIPSEGHMYCLMQPSCAILHSLTSRHGPSLNYILFYSAHSNSSHLQCLHLTIVNIQCRGLLRPSRVYPFNLSWHLGENTSCSHPYRHGKITLFHSDLIATNTARTLACSMPSWLSLSSIHHCFHFHTVAHRISEILPTKA